MVDIEEVNDNASKTLSASEERLLDAEEIENAAATLKRPTARMQLESLAKKLRKEASALKVVESQHSTTTSSSVPKASVSSSSPPDTASTAASSKPTRQESTTPPTTSGSSVLYCPIDRFAFDAGSSSDKFVTLYVNLPGVGDIPKDQVECHFEKASFDLIVKGLKGKSYRLKKDQLEHDIVPDKSKIVIKADKILVKLAKVKGEYGSYDFWSKLTDNKRNEKKKTNSNPAASITELMKDMYESGDDKMRKMIGETMMKQQRGELGKGSDMGLGDFDGDL